MPQALSLPRKIALVLLPCVAALVVVAVWQAIALPPDLPESTLTQAYAVLTVSIVVGIGLCLGFVLRLRRQLRTRTRYLLWTATALYFLVALFLALLFGRWSVGSVAIGVACMVALGIALWGATAERQRTIEYTLFPKPRKSGQAKKAIHPVRQEA